VAEEFQLADSYAQCYLRAMPQGVALTTAVNVAHCTAPINIHQGVLIFLHMPVKLVLGREMIGSARFLKPLLVSIMKRTIAPRDPLRTVLALMVGVRSGRWQIRER
jgi:hypothetical protein